MTDYLSTSDCVLAAARAIGYTNGTPTGIIGARIVDTLNDAIRRVYNAAQWPQLRLIESRIYRPPYDPIGFKKDQECFYNDKYWRATKNNPMGIPGELNADWEELPLDRVSKFIALDQPWEHNKISLTGVNLDAFAYRRDPRYFPDEQPMTGCKWAGDYPGGGTSRVILPENAPPVVYCAYLPRAPRVVLDTYEQSVEYSYGQRVYHEKNTWRCAVSSTSGVAPGEYNEHSPWAIERIPEFLFPAIKAYLKAEFQDDEQGRAVSYNRYQSELRDLIDTYFGLTGARDSVVFEGDDD